MTNRVKNLLFLLGAVLIALLVMDFFAVIR